VIKPIKDIVLPLWNELLAEAKSGDFLFSKGLIPGLYPINTDQVTKRWNRHVKKKRNVNCDFYSLKHLNLDETAMHLGLSDAAAMASHTSTSVTLKHYTHGEHQRQLNRLKKVNNPL
jgi:integrase